MSTDVSVTNDRDHHRYEARDADGVVAGFIDYQETAELVVLTHTEVDRAFEGGGVGSALARAALDDVRERGLKALVLCPFILSWLGRHPGYADLLHNAPAARATDGTEGGDR